MNRAIKYRLYPDEKQAQWLAFNFGCCRKIYNEALNWRTSAYKADGTVIRYHDTATALPQVKKFYPWLKDSDSASLQQSLLHLDAAFTGFFKGRSGYPAFKSRRNRQSYSTPLTNGNIAVLDDCIRLPKAGKVKAVIHRTAPESWRLCSATVSKERDGAFYASILYEVPEASAAGVEFSRSECLGLDYKSDGLYMDSDGRSAGMPKYYRQAEKRLARAQRRLSRKKGARKGETASGKFKKQRLKAAKISRHTASQRMDFLHKLSHELAGRYRVICVEDLNLKDMSRHHAKGFHLGKSTADNGYAKFLSMLEYKLADKGGTLIRVDKWYASSQICHICGHRNPTTKDLSVRRVVCPECGAEYDRDINAAQNIRDEGWRIYLSST